MNIDKYKKNQKLMSKVLEKEKGETHAAFDGYEIHSDLITWALFNIPTKKLKDMIKKYE
jgi:hypothetical protein